MDDCTDSAGHLFQEYEDETIRPLDIALVNVNGEIHSVVSMESELKGKDGRTTTYSLNLVITDKTKEKKLKPLKTVNLWKNYKNWVLESIGK